MPAIGIVDDRQDLRQTLKRTIDLRLRDKPGWESVDVAPFEDKHEYTSWIAENDISVLLLDQRLHESAPGSIAVDYQGHDLVDYLRQLGPLATLPIWIITAYSGDKDLRRRFASVEDILHREEFSQRADEYVPRFIRIGTKFYQENQQELERLSILAKKIAQGDATAEEIAEAGGLQIARSLPFSQLIERSNWVQGLEDKVTELEKLEQSIRQHLQSTQDNEMDQNT